MPRGKVSRMQRAQFLKRTSRPVEFEALPPAPNFVARRGTGTRHAAQRWTPSLHTTRSWKMCIPAESPGKELVLVLGDSHLRGLVDSFVEMPQGKLSFGYLSVPGATAKELRTEFLNAAIPRTPSVMCVLATSNELQSCNTISQAGQDFDKLISSAREFCPNVFVLDFPPRLNVEPGVQEHYRQEFHRMAKKNGVKYVTTTDNFPLDDLKLWCRDGVHLSDDHGMQIFAQQLWISSYEQLQSAIPDPPVPPRETAIPGSPVSPRTAPRSSPTLVFTEDVVRPSPPTPLEWALVLPDRTVIADPDQEEPCEALEEMVQTEVGKPIVSQDSPAVLNPVWFSKDYLDVLGDADSPMSSFPKARKKSSPIHRKAAAFVKKIPNTKRKVSPATSIPCSSTAVREQKKICTFSDQEKMCPMDEQHVSEPLNGEDGQKAKVVVKNCSVLLHPIKVTMDHHDMGKATQVFKSFPDDAMPVTDRTSTYSSKHTPTDVDMDAMDKEERLSQDSPAVLNPICFIEDFLDIVGVGDSVISFPKARKKSTLIHRKAAAYVDKISKAKRKVSPAASIPCSSTAVQEQEKICTASDQEKMCPMDEQHVLNPLNGGDEQKGKVVLNNCSVLLHPMKRVTDYHDVVGDARSPYSSTEIPVVERTVSSTNPVPQLQGKTTPRDLKYICADAVPVTERTFTDYSEHTPPDVEMDAMDKEEKLLQTLKTDDAKQDSAVNMYDIEYPPLTCEGPTKPHKTKKRARKHQNINRASVSSKAADGDLNRTPDRPERSQQVITSSSVSTAADQSQISGGHVMSIVSGSIHQASPCFDKNRGKQCTTNSIVAIMTHAVKSALTWETCDIDDILVQGDLLYSSMKDQNQISHGNSTGYVLVDELPRQHTLGGHRFTLEYSPTLTGDLDLEHYDPEVADLVMPLDVAIQTSLFVNDGCLLTVRRNTCAIIRKDLDFAIFDPHPRDAQGGLDIYGTSRVFFYSSIVQVQTHINNLIISLYEDSADPDALYEVTGLKVFVDQTSHSQNSASFSVQTLTSNVEVCSDNDSDLTGAEISQGSCISTFDVPATAVAPATVDSNDPSIYIVSETAPSSVTFNHFPIPEKHKICMKLGIVPSLQDEAVVVKSVTLDQPTPCLNIGIKSDGNCYFSTISHIFTGTQDNHRSFRLAVVKHIETNPELYSNIIRCEYSSVHQYVTKSNMKRVKTWATEVEIQASADLFKTDIYTYSSQRWLKYKSNSPLSINTGIYLNHCSGNHYQPIACVKDISSNNCLSLSSFSYNNHVQASIEVMSPSKASTDGDKRIHRKRYAEDTDYSQIKRLKLQERYKSDNAYQSKKQLYVINKYAEDEKYQLKLKQSSINKYGHDAEFQTEVKHFSTKKYATDDVFQEKVKLYSQHKYATDEVFQEKVKQNSQHKYATDEVFQEKVKQNSQHKYATDEVFQEKVKLKNKKKYTNDSEHQQKKKALSIHNYATKPTLCTHVKNYNKNKNKQNPEFNMYLKQHTKDRRKSQSLLKQDINFVIQQFQEKVQYGPKNVCCSCHRLLFKHQVLECIKDQYDKCGSSVAFVAKKCITLTYLHNCGDLCSPTCKLLKYDSNTLWICFTCHSKIMKGHIPEQSVVNNLQLDSVPEELNKLNSLEQHLISMNIPFMKLLALPKGSQNGVHGPISCIPSNCDTVSKILPRSEDQDMMLRVKLKRKLTYKGHYKYQYVHSQKVQKALRYLKLHNKWYKDVQFNEDWRNPLEKTNDQEETCYPEEPSDVNHATMNQEDNPEDQIDDHINDKQQHGMYLDTCIQPVDIAQEVMDHHFDSIMSVAPAEGNSPVRLLTDTGNEAKCFPALFPNGTGTFHDVRQQKITISKYLNARILNADGRFGSNLDYIFYAQYLSEINQVVSNVSIAMRKGYHGEDQGQITSSMLANKGFLQNVLHQDRGYKFLKPIRGTPVFWQGVQKDLFAMVRQLGIPTWFCSFSSADLRWTEMMEAFLHFGNKQINVKDLDWSNKCDLLKTNPVTAARMFDHRFRCFLKDVIMSPANPIGKIIDYFYRVEFQQRGSPHCHCLFWVENAPKIGKNSDEEVVAFIDKYVTCDLPPESDVLHEVVSSVQMHSKKHSKSCKKRGTPCRFNFPRPPSIKTFICQSPTKQNEETKKEKSQTEQREKEKPTIEQMEQEQLRKSQVKEKAKEIMSKVKLALSNENITYDRVEDLFHSLGFNQSTFEKAFSLCSKKTTVVHKRNVHDVWVNQYNTDLLRCWNANMDIQYVCDAYACVVYIISYISKAEREMGLLLKHAENEVKNKGNMEAKEALNKLGSVFLHNREVSAQESVYRVTNMRLKESSRKVVFVPTGDNIIKMSLPLNVIQNKAQQGDISTDQIWMTNITDRYNNRPKCNTFHDMCLATFASEYRTVPKTEKSKAGVIALSNNSGFVKKRTRSDVAVVRFCKFSVESQPEKHYQSLLQLFLPHYSPDQLKPSPFHRFEDFYSNGSITDSSGNPQLVKDVVDFNRSKFTKETELEHCEEVNAHNEHHEDGWAELCPETESDRLECLQEMSLNKIDNPAERDIIPDLESTEKPLVSFEFPKQTINHKEAQSLMRSLNELQSKIFYKIRQWCLDKINGKEPAPFHTFISGGAGTGKSTLIKAVYHEASRLLSRLSTNPDDIHVLLTAPTGVAAFNINATTIHHSFAISNNISLPYQPLKEEKVNTLRSRLKDLQILVIDEISMVDNKLLTYIHGRLRQIKQCSDYSPFGKCSIIAVGDFFQLPPVKGKPLYTDQLGFTLWQNTFSHIELTDIMRQKNHDFALTLNRIRKHRKDAKLNKLDETSLKQCETGMGEDTEDLHIFPTNRDVDAHNFKMLHKVCSDIVQIKAQDFQKNQQTGQINKKTAIPAFNQHSYLDGLLSVGQKARVMLIKNIDISDGLVNGVFGTVSHIRFQGDPNFPSTIFVNFDDTRIGSKLRGKFPCSVSGLGNATPIRPDEDKLTNGRGVRHQFPLRLAWACTIHKVQGLTLDKAVVSFKRIFSAGQAYVALSRVKSLQGLIIQDFKASSIYAKTDIDDKLQLMPKFIDSPVTTTFSLKLSLQNIQGLTTHLLDLKNDQRMLDADVMCLVETWLKDHDQLSNMMLPGWTFHHKVRNDCYSDKGVMSSLKNKNHGGVGFFHKNTTSCNIVDAPSNDLEAIVFNILCVNCNVAVLYRPPSYSIRHFKSNMTKLLHHFDHYSGGKIIMGDFNDDALVTQSLVTFMQQQGYSQMVTGPTTEKGSLLDHVYIKDIDLRNITVEIISTYYSDHEAVCIGFVNL